MEEQLPRLAEMGERHARRPACRVRRNTADFVAGGVLKAVRDGRPLLLPAEAAVILGLDKCYRDPGRVVLRLCRRGELVAVRVGGRNMITPESVDALRYG